MLAIEQRLTSVQPLQLYTTSIASVWVYDYFLTFEDEVCVTCIDLTEVSGSDCRVDKVCLAREEILE